MIQHARVMKEKTNEAKRSVSESPDYIPEASRLGGEAEGATLLPGSGKIYVPQTLGSGQKPRGWYQYAFNHNADLPVFRDFAERAKFVIGPEVASRRELAERLGRPEWIDLPVTSWGHSRGGKPAWDTATDPADMERSLAVIGHHAATFRSVIEDIGRPADGGPPPPLVKLLPDCVAGDPRGAVPVWNIGGDRDKHQYFVQALLQVSALLSELGWTWSFTLGRGESHQTNDIEALQLRLLWLEEVANLRIVEGDSRDGPSPLQAIDAATSWVGYLELLPPDWGDGGYRWWRVADIGIYPVSEAPGKGVVAFDDGRVGGYVWLPSERFARAWKAYQWTGSVRGDDSPRVQTNVIYGLTDTAEAKLGWGLFENDWCHVYFSALNLPDFRGDTENVTWEAVGLLPDWRVLNRAGRFQTRSPKPGTYRFTLRAGYGGKSWDGEFLVGLRDSEDDSALSLKVEGPENGNAAPDSCRLRWSSSLPLGIMQWHSSRDGDLRGDSGDLGSEGVIAFPALTPGEHLITLMAYSSAPQTQRQAVSLVVRVTPE